MTAKLKVGDRLWYVPGGRLGKPSEVAVTEVGRKYAKIQVTAGHLERILINGLGVVDWPHGKCYESRIAHLEELNMNAQWDLVQTLIKNMRRPPAHITREHIETIKSILEGRQ